MISEEVKEEVRWKSTKQRRTEKDKEMWNEDQQMSNQPTYSPNQR